MCHKLFRSRSNHIYTYAQFLHTAAEAFYVVALQEWVRTSKPAAHHTINEISYFTPIIYKRDKWLPL